MSFIRAKKVGDTIYYSEVENRKVNGKVVQKHIRYIGKDKDRPSAIPLERVQFGYIATRLMQGDLSSNELCDMIERMGHHVDRENLERIGLYYNFKKTPFPFHSTGRYRESREMHYMRKKTDGVQHISKIYQNAVRRRRHENTCKNVF